MDIAPPSPQAREKWLRRLSRYNVEWHADEKSEIRAQYTLSGKVADYYFNSNMLAANPRLLCELAEDFYAPHAQTLGNETELRTAQEISEPHSRLIALIEAH